MNPPEQMWQQAEKVTQVYKLLANTHRLMILCVLLEQEELCVGALNQHIPLNASPLSQHLKLLRDEGWLATRKQGQTVYYRIADDNIAQMIALAKKLYCDLPA
ncbi:metalloregulator ArsR/SmtB family transcription factor [Vitreoscilla massiliensis]|uniref:Metalloregulator ArsR/SmtB family transcription factor n=1 Tax=Vitreoscilla massiliensis TaxID=1689272 RepID=A0ABY4DYU7_9NEIS|nr:metalloregulator ArsR/SmtB family transcription factor [Vitreoscilla massiliensis]UOO88702.1 metalloregulator ArsR/SmtB family transcription factor [Vitreoscilla massiliensis]